MMESSICVPTDLGSNAILTPVPKTPEDETPAQLLISKKIDINNINFNFIFLI